MIPGQGYQIQMFQPVTFYYPANTQMVAKSDYSRYKTQFFSEIQSTGNNMSILIPLSAWEDVPEKGDEIGIFTTNGELAGSAVFDGDLCMIPVWGDDEMTTRQEGLGDREGFLIKLYRKSSGLVSELKVLVWESGDGTFVQDGMAVAAKMSEIDMEMFTVGEVSPNPATSWAIIDFNIPAETKVTTGIYNALGELVQVPVSRAYSSGRNQIEIELNGMTPGLYFIRIESDEFRTSKRFTIVGQ
jgi:hypothetical protein